MAEATLEAANARIAQLESEKKATDDARQVAANKHLNVQFHGSVGGPFAMYALTPKEFGDPKPSIKLAGLEVKALAWTEHFIKGDVPDHVKPGPALFEVNGKTYKVQIAE
jgi:hypothetical protein